MRIPEQYISYQGPVVDDPQIMDELPPDLRDHLAAQNGYVAFEGALHVRGAVSDPEWHSIRLAWKSDFAFHQLYDQITETDVPFAEDCVGDQFFLRGLQIAHLNAETGEIDLLEMNLDQFLEACLADPLEFLLAHPLKQLQQESGSLEPGQLIHAFPPFSTKEGGAESSLRAVPALEVHRWHAELARVLGSLHDGEKLEIRLVDDDR